MLAMRSFLSFRSAPDDACGALDGGADRHRRLLLVLAEVGRQLALEQLLEGEDRLVAVTPLALLDEVPSRVGTAPAASGAREAQVPLVTGPATAPVRTILVLLLDVAAVHDRSRLSDLSMVVAVVAVVPARRSGC